MKCFYCGQSIVELPDGHPDRISEDWHYAPAFVVEVAKLKDEGCRCAVLCWPCMNRIKPDMWLSGDHWDLTNPAVLFDQLPTYDHDAVNRDELETYEGVL